MNLRLVFFGTPYFAATILDYLVKKKASVVAVITKPDKPRGRSKMLLPPPVKMHAEERGIPVFQPPKASAPEFAETLRSFDADLFVVAAYSEILKESVLEMPKLGCINVHASLLPKYRGAAPIQRCIMEGDKESGVTIMAMAKELDAGGMLARVATPITEEMTAGELEERLAHIGAEALWDILETYDRGEATPIPQNPAEVTYAPKLKFDDGEIDWSQPATRVHNHIRGVTPKPGAWCWIEVRGQRKRLLVKKSCVMEAKKGPSGKIVTTLPGLVVHCANDAVKLLEVQLEGKKPLSTEAFLRGISKENLHIARRC